VKWGLGAQILRDLIMSNPLDFRPGDALAHLFVGLAGIWHQDYRTEPLEAIRAPLMPTRAKLHYGWVVVAVTFSALLVSRHSRCTRRADRASKMNSLVACDDLPRRRGHHLLTGLVGPFAAAVMDRFGVRRTMALALALTAAGVALTPMMRQSWQLVLLWGVIVGTGCGVIGTLLAAYIPARWFRARQGLVIACLMASNAAGQLVFLPDHGQGLVTLAGWRVMSLALARHGFSPSSRWSPG